jgi:hypothetical protein
VAPTHEETLMNAEDVLADLLAALRRRHAEAEQEAAARWNDNGVDVALIDDLGDILDEAERQLVRVQLLGSLWEGPDDARRPPGRVLQLVPRKTREAG